MSELHKLRKTVYVLFANKFIKETCKKEIIYIFLTFVLVSPPKPIKGFRLNFLLKMAGRTSYPYFFFL
jgi:hypothetical protein